MEFRVLGPLEVFDDDGAPIAIGSSIQQAILCMLLTSRPEVVPAERMIVEIWGDDAPQKALKNLQVHISTLRDRLEPNRPRGADGSVVLTRATGYVIESQDLLDRSEFERLTAAAVAQVETSPSHARRDARAALDLWRGEVMDGVGHYPFARAEAERLGELRLRAHGVLVDARIAAGEHEDVIPELEALVAEHPLREGYWASLMLALYRSGRQADALAAYTRASTTLGEELGIEPSVELRDLEEQILLQAADLAVPERRFANLPVPVDGFIGRKDLIGAVEAALANGRLVSLTGPGGVGKSRLALEFARSVTTDVCLVELGPLDDPALVGQTVNSALGLARLAERSVIDSIADHLSGADLVLLLDNCEHVLDEVAGLVERVLASAGGVRVVATSREPLHIPGEQVVAVPSMSSSGGVELFIERATAAAPDFRPTPDDLTAIADLCAALDGLPLAIELAAARVASMSVADLVTLIEDDPLLGAGRSRTALARHRTVEAAIEWSYELLEEEEQRLFEGLGVFAGSFDLPAARAIGGGAGFSSSRVASLLSDLVDRSMISMSRSSEIQYTLLQAVRAYARERLEESPASGPVEAAHDEWAIELANDGSAKLIGPERAAWSARLRRASGDFRAVLKRAERDQRPDQGVRLLSAMETMLLESGDHEGFLTTAEAMDHGSWLERLDQRGAVTADLLAPVLSTRGLLLMMRGDDEGATSVLRRAIELFDELDDGVGRARAQLYLACALWHT